MEVMENMTWQQIPNSAAIEAIAYDAASYTLGVMTKASATKAGVPYFYIDVPPEVHQQLMLADSKGKFWLTVIKPKYQCRKSDNTPAQQSPGADPLHPKVARVITETAATAPAPAAKAEPPEILNLTIATAPGNGPGHIGNLEQLVERLRAQMNRHCADLLIEIDDLARRALATLVIDEASYTSAAELGKSLAEKRKAITAMMKPTKQAIDSVKDVVLDKEKDLLAQVAAGEDRLKKICTDYRVAEQKRATEAANAERQQKLREAEDKRIAEAEKAQEAGRTVLAEKLLSTPVTAPKVVVEAAVPKVVGVQSRTNWKWRIVDADKIPAHYFVLDESAISAVVRRDKDKTAIPGVEAYPEESTAF